MRARLIFAAIAGLLLATPVFGQLGLPPLAPPPLGSVTGDIGEAARRTTGALDAAAAGLARLAADRIDRLGDLIRRNRDVIEADAEGAPSRKGELLVVAPTPGDLETARAAGFTVLATEELGDLGFGVVRLRVPAGQSLSKAQTALVKLLPNASITADTLNFQAGGARTRNAASPQPVALPPISTKVGVIDGAPGPAAGIAEQRGFATGAPIGSDHGSAIVSLLQLAGVRKIAVADVFGTDRAGGNALAIARGLDWLVGSGSRVITISLVGPANPLLARAVAAAQGKGVIIVAAVGNDGPAAPPSYPASYAGIVAVTGVDGRNRALIEAGRALHLDYAAPGADMLARNAFDKWVGVRGTSYAAPLVAARVAAALDRGPDVLARLDREAQRLGSGRQALLFGRGLLCGACRKLR